MQSYVYRLNYLLLLRAVLLLGVIALGYIGLGPDEAQYWTWSKQLDWGYYSKPPGIAWQIAFGTFFFGDTELGIRFGAVLLGFLLPIAIYYLALASGTKPVTAFWAAVAFALTPLGFLSSLLAITDTGFVLFWTLALIPVAKALKNGTPLSYPLVGFLIALGALFKWPIYLLWGFIFLSWLWAPKFRSGKILLGIAFSLLGLLPSLYWNATHEWATFRHVQATIEGGSQVESRASGNFWAFLGEQFILFSPILLTLLLLALRKKRDGSKAINLCALITALSLACFLFFSFFQKMQGNWIDFAYPTAAVFLAWAVFEREYFKKSWFLGGVILASMMSLFALSLPLWAPFQIDPFKQNRGGVQLAHELEELGYNSKEQFLLADRYQTSSLISFYAPGQKRSYFLNLNGIRKNQFSFWPSLKEQVGRSGYYIAIDKSDKFANPLLYITKLEPYFQKVEVKKIAPLVTSNGLPVKSALILKVEGYNGMEPTHVNLY